MTQEKIETGIDYLNSDMNSQISLYMGDEVSRSNLALASRMFGWGEVQDKRIIAKLSQYIAAGKIDMAVKLLAIRPDLCDTIQFLLKPALFRLAGFGEQDKMEIILKHYPQFFFDYAAIKDISNVYPVIDSENSKGITVFQHALWAGDMRYMCNMMLDCLPKNAFGDTIRIELLRQYNELMDKGVVYVVNNEQRRETQFRLKPLIDAHQNYGENFGNRSWAERDFHWCTDVGLPQNLLPAIVRHHYCNPEKSFWEAGFTEPKLIRSIVFINYAEAGEKQMWDDSLVGLGSKFAMAWLEACTPSRLQGASLFGSAVLILAKQLTALCEVGTKIDLPTLMQRLVSPIQSLDEDQELRTCNLF